MKRRLSIGVLVAVVLAALAGFAWHWWQMERYLVSTDDAFVAADTSVVSPKLQAYVRAVRIVDNQQVHQGEVLVELDDRDYSARVAQAEATLASKRGDLGTIDSKLALQKPVIAEAEAGVVSAGADLKRSEADFRRYKDLLATDFASRQRYEQADADYRKAQAALDRARSDLLAQRAEIDVLNAEHAQTEATIAEAKAALDLARIDLSNTLIRAPFDGVVGNKGVQPGQFVQPGSQLLSVVALPSVYVIANFKETQLARIIPGQDVDLSFDAYPGVSVTGSVESFSPASGAQFSLLPPENATGNFTKIVQRVPVRIAVPADNPLAGKLRPGLSLTATVNTKTAGQVPLGHAVLGAVPATLNTGGEAEAHVR